MKEQSNKVVRKKETPVKKNKKESIMQYNKAIIEETMQEWKKRVENTVGIPDLMNDKDRDDITYLAQLLETTGSIHTTFSIHVIGQAAMTCFDQDLSTSTRFVEGFMNGLRPQNELECTLVTQMIGVHNLAMEYMRRSMVDHGEVTLDFAEYQNEYSSRAVRLMHLFTKQIEILERLQGKSKQKVSVGQVNVNDGGQAIVGNVEAKEEK